MDDLKRLTFRRCYHDENHGKQRLSGAKQSLKKLDRQLFDEGETDYWVCLKYYQPWEEFGYASFNRPLFE